MDFWLAIAAICVPALAAIVSAVLLHLSNRAAHAGIVKRIDRGEAGIVKRIDRGEARDEAHRLALESIARDVSYMAGRQAERDQR